MGLLVTGVGNAVDAVAQVEAEPPRLVLCAGMVSGRPGAELLARLCDLHPGMGLLLLDNGANAATLADTSRRGVRLAGVLPRPASPERAERVLLRALAPPLPLVDVEGADWNGEEALRRNQGGVERVPPARALHVAARCGLTGTLTIYRPSGDVAAPPLESDLALGEEDDDETDAPTIPRVILTDPPATFVLRAGQLMQVRGVPGLFSRLRSDATADADLFTGISAIAGSGLPVEAAVAAAAEVLGDWLGRTVGRSGGSVQWSPVFHLPPGAFAFPTPLPRLITAGLRAVRGPDLLLDLWGAHRHAQVLPRLPEDAPEARWGLDPTALRVLRAAGSGGSVQEVVERAVGPDPGRRVEVLRGLDTLYVLGILRVLPDQSTPADDLAALRPEPLRPVAPADPAMVAALRRALNEMSGRHPVDVLGVTERGQLNVEQVSALYRERIKLYHPDRHAKAPEIQALAEQCFDRVRLASETLSTPAGLAEAGRLLDARARGENFVSDADQQSARTVLKKGEILFRAREWAQADALLTEALRLDPTSAHAASLAALSGAWTRRLTPDEAITQLSALKLHSAQREAEVLLSVGQLHRMAGRPADASTAFRAAFGKDPQNHEVLRELRLEHLRNPTAITDKAILDAIHRRREAETARPAEARASRAAADMRGDSPAAASDAMAAAAAAAVEASEPRPVEEKPSFLAGLFGKKK